MCIPQLEKSTLSNRFFVHESVHRWLASPTSGAVLRSVKKITLAVLDRVQNRYCGQSRGNECITVLELKTPFWKIWPKSSCLYKGGIDFSSHISENNPLVLHYYANKQQTFDAGWDYFTKLPMITCYDLMFYEPSTSFLTSLLWYKHFS